MWNLVYKELINQQINWLQFDVESQMNFRPEMIEYRASADVGGKERCVKRNQIYYTKLAGNKRLYVHFPYKSILLLHELYFFLFMKMKYYLFLNFSWKLLTIYYTKKINFEYKNKIILNPLKRRCRNLEDRKSKTDSFVVKDKE